MLGERGRDVLTPYQKKNIQQWLHSIRRTAFTLDNLKRAIVTLEVKKECRPLGSGWKEVDLSSIIGAQESYEDFLAKYEERLEFLNVQIERCINKLKDYHDMMDSMRIELPNGSLAAQIIHFKYYLKVNPDCKLYATMLYCTEETFYRTHRKALRFILDTLPHVANKMTVS